MKLLGILASCLLPLVAGATWPAGKVQEARLVGAVKIGSGFAPG